MVTNDSKTSEKDLIQNIAYARQELVKTLLNLGKDINTECGYPETISPTDYHLMYKREGIASRVVDVWADESWQLNPTIYEVEDAEVKTAFEEQWKFLNEKHNLWNYLYRADRLSGVGRFGVLLIGIDDGEDLSEPVESVLNDKPSGEKKLLYLRPLQESVVTIKEFERDITNPRFGQPLRYSLVFEENSGKGVLVHWTRVIHLADDRLMSEVYGTPRMEKSYNRLLDVRKILSGSGEMFWKGAFPGYSFEVGDNSDQTVQIDKDSLRAEMDAYMNGLQRYLAVSGMSVKSLSPQVADPSQHFQSQMDAIAIILGIPKRILFGSEQAQLASGQDKETWNARLKKRQENYLTPLLVRPFVDRLILMGVLPEPVEYTVEWPDLNSQKDTEKAEIADKWAGAIAKFVSGDCESIISFSDFLSMFGGLDPEEIRQIVQSVQDNFREEEDGAEETPSGSG